MKDGERICETVYMSIGGDGQVKSGHELLSIFLLHSYFHCGITILGKPSESLEGQEIRK